MSPISYTDAMIYAFLYLYIFYVQQSYEINSELTNQRLLKGWQFGTRNGRRRMSKNNIN